MLAISNSRAQERVRLAGTITVVLAMLCLTPGRANPAQTQDALTRAEETFRTSRALYQKDRSKVEAAWQFAKACFLLAEFLSDKDQHEEIAHQGIEAARRSVALDSSSAEAHYYLALNLGQLARTKRLGALRLVQEMEREFKKAIEFNEKIEHAGPHRSLGLLYRDAPGWPTSIGSKTKARAELERAAELFPNYPGNRLCLAESYAKWGEKNSLRSEVEALKEILPKARKELAGESWSADWAEWDQRWEKLQKGLEKSAKRPR